MKKKCYNCEKLKDEEDGEERHIDEHTKKFFCYDCLGIGDFKRLVDGILKRKKKL